MSEDYYAILGVDRDATDDEIRKSYRRLARQLHPDINPDPAQTERFKQVQRAYEVLSDPRKRERYDLGVDPDAAGAGNGNGNGFGFGFADIMDAFFGSSGTRGPRPRARRGQDALIRLELDLEETAFGTVRELTLDTAVICGTCQGAGTAPGTTPRVCPVCHGRGEVQQVTRSFLGQVMTARPCAACHGYGTVIDHACPECGGDGRIRARRTISVQVPAGVTTGTRLQLSGEGEVGPGGGAPGDLFVEIIERPHPVFTREGDDLHATIRLPMTAAALGTSVELETLDGVETLEVRPGTQSGQIITIRGHGVTHLRGGGRGDLIVHVEVTTPTQLDSAQEELLRQLAALRGEEQPDGQLTSPGQPGLFSRLRDAFNSR